MGIPLRVLVVEDSEDDTAMLVRELRLGDYDVTFERVDSPQAMSRALEKDWNVVMGDYSMPHFSGTGALKLLRQKGLDIPFIFVSGTIGEETAIASLKSGAQDYIMKGNLRRLLPSVRRELEEAEQRRQRRILEQRLQQLERFEAIGKLAGGIAHDFNNVIAVVLGLAQLGHDEAPAGSGLRERFRKISDHAERAGKLTAQLLAFARRQVLQTRHLNLNTVVNGMLTFLRTAIGESVELQAHLAPDLEGIEADPTQIEQVLMNLCMNARDAMPNGGRLIVQTGQTEITDEFCQVHTYGSPGRYILLTISDTGTGMDAATAEHIFEPFFTTKEVGKGTGLGLATVYGIVKQHSGFINVYSEPGQGAAFRVYLPITSGTAAPREPNVSARTSARGTETVLVAEDNGALRELARETLVPQGYTVMLASNGQEAVRLFEEDVDKVQLVILDMVMPFLSGLQAYERISAIKPNVPVIFTTGHTVDSESLNGQLARGAVFLAKPFAPDMLRLTVRHALDRQQPPVGKRSHAGGRSRTTSDPTAVWAIACPTSSLKR
jgi:signal transduction histidine kinase